MSFVKIKDLFHFEKGTLQSTKATPGEFDFITAAADWKTHIEYTHDCEALIFAAAASGSLGRTHYVNGRFISSDLCFILTPKDKEKYPIDIQFYHLIFNAFKEEIVRNTKSGTSKEAIGLTVFGNYKLPYFHIKKQKATKEAFLKAQELSQTLDNELSNQLELIKKLRQAFLKEAMQGELVEQDPNDESASELLLKIKADKDSLIKAKKIKKQKPLPSVTENELSFEIPQNWVLTRIGEICTKVTDGFHHTPKKLNNGNIYISATHIRDHGIDWANCQYISDKDHNELYKKAYPKRGEILITNRGAGCATPAIIDIDEEFSFQNAALIGFNQSLVNNRYIFYFILKNRDDIMNFFVNGGLQPMLSNVVLSSIPVPLPPLAEQLRIVSKLDNLMFFCNGIDRRIRESQQQSEILLQQCLREALGLNAAINQDVNLELSISEKTSSKYNSNTLLMEIQELLKIHGKLKALELWQMSKFYGKTDEERSIDGFYAELKKLIEKEKVVKETEKGFLELV